MFGHIARWIVFSSCIWFWCQMMSLASLFSPDPADLVSRAWQMEEGLPQNSVNCFAQTPDGYLWLGTFNGLARFDGIRFTVFTPVNTPALASSRIVRLFCDRRGQLWVVVSHADGAALEERLRAVPGLAKQPSPAFIGITLWVYRWS